MTQQRNDIEITSNVSWKGRVSDKIITLPNVISFVRLLLIPIYFVLLLNGHDTPAAILFALAAATDWVDGYIARTTDSVSKLGRILDPAVDRLLMIFGAVGLLIVGRIPFWMVMLVLLRDAIMLVGYYVMLRRYQVRVDVIFVGKLATAVLFFGFFLLLLGVPVLPSLGLFDVSWLPGINMQPAPLGIWFVYVGLVLAIFTTTYYAMNGMLAVYARDEDNEEVER